MKFIKLTLGNGKIISLNIAMIGDIGNSSKDGTKTNIGHLTHNNGGFNVLESVEEVEAMIIEAVVQPVVFVDKFTFGKSKK